MSKRVLMSLPVGERVGIAFSGGLDTSAAVAWMRHHGAIPYTYTADLGQYDEPELDTVPDRAKQYGAEQARLVDCRDELVHEGLIALQCGAFHIRTAGRTYFNTTPARTGRHRHVARAGDARRRRRRVGRRQHLQGQRHRALLPLRPARQPEAADLQAVARRAVRRRARRASGDERVPRRARAAVPRPAEKAYSTDANIWGATHEAKSLEELSTGIEIVSPIMGVAHWDPSVEIEHRGRHRPFRGGLAGRHRRHDLRLAGSTWCSRRTRSADVTGSA